MGLELIISAVNWEFEKNTGTPLFGHLGDEKNTPARVFVGLFFFFFFLTKDPSSQAWADFLSPSAGGLSVKSAEELSLPKRLGRISLRVRADYL